MLSAAVKLFVERSNLKTLLTLKVKQSLICLVGTGRPIIHNRTAVNFVLENVNTKQW
jgi:hypothetical protein